MMNRGKVSFWQYKIVAIATGIALLLIASPAMAHHLMDGRTPSNFFEGFITGLGHPIIGLDHLAFIVSVGLVSAVKRQGILIPIAFVLSAMAGAGLHLAQLNVPGVELFVSGSILLFGILLVRKDSPNTAVVMALAAIAGIFHGYAYGESIFGAEMTPLLAYLLGFTAIQLIVAIAAFWIGNNVLQRHSQQHTPVLRSAGLVICGVGLAFLSSQIMNAIFSLPKG